MDFYLVQFDFTMKHAFLNLKLAKKTKEVFIIP